MRVFPYTHIHTHTHLVFPISPTPPLDAEPSSRSLMCCSWRQTSRSWPGFKPDLYRPADHCQSSLSKKNSLCYRRAACGRAADLLRSHRYAAVTHSRCDDHRLRLGASDISKSSFSSAKARSPCLHGIWISSGLLLLSAEGAAASPPGLSLVINILFTIVFGVVDFTCFTWRRHKHGEWFLSCGGLNWGTSLFCSLELL